MSGDADQSAFHELMLRLQAGDQAAASQVFHHFSQRLIALARAQLSARLKNKLDPEDVTQSVFKSFYARQAKAELEIENWESLWGILVVITLRKCGRRAESFTAACRDVRRELPPAPTDEKVEVGWDAAARDPTPEEAAILAEMVEGLMRPLFERERNMLALRLEGHTVAEISALVGRSERTVHRVLDGVRRHLERLRG